MLKLPNTLSFRLTLWYFSTFVVFLTVAFLILYLSFDSVLQSRIDEDLIEDLKEYRILFDQGGMAKVKEEIDQETVSDSHDEFVRVLDKNGMTLLESDLSGWEILDIDLRKFQKTLKSDSDSIVQTVKFKGQEHDTRMIFGKVGQENTLQIGQSLEEKDEIVELLLTVFAIIFCVLIPLAASGVWFMARRAVSGIEEVSRVAKTIENGDFDHRVSVSRVYGDEIQTLVDAFNAMAGRISKLIFELREMINNIAHDLRSPLTRIRATLEGSLSPSGNPKEFKKAAEDTLEECDRLIQLINTALDVAEAESGLATTIKSEINLSTLITDACELFEPVAEQKGIDLSCDLEMDCMFQGNKQNLQRLLANLIDNALKYTPKKGKVMVKLAAHLQEILIEVADTGIGISPRDQSRVFERFFCCDPSRSNGGYGLGLSFARAVTAAHNGYITLTSRPEKGSTFTIHFPKMQSAN